MNREHWLTEAVVALKKEFFEPAAMTFEREVRISTGWSRGSKKAIGQCWSSSASTGGFVEIFISPQLDDAVKVLATTLHELVHAQLGTDKGHGKEFKSIVTQFGLSGKVTATHAEEGSPLYAKLQLMAETIGEFPHKSLLPRDATKAKSEGESKGGWIRFKSVNADGYRCMVSPKSLLEFGIPKDPWGEELIPTKGE